jgi:hypothetical protein
MPQRYLRRAARAGGAGRVGAYPGVTPDRVASCASSTTTPADKPSSRPTYAPAYDRYLRLDVIHDTATGAVTVFVNGGARGTFQDHGKANHYFKLGVYHQKGMSDRCDVYAKNIHIRSPARTTAPWRPDPSAARALQHLLVNSTKPRPQPHQLIRRHTTISPLSTPGQP